MTKAEFGDVPSYYAMYCFDKTFAETEYKKIPLPCTNMPIEYGHSENWSLLVGKNIKKDVEVTITNNKNGKIVKYSNKSNNFNFPNDNFGLEGYIIFIGPSSYKDGDSYRVDFKGSNVKASYDVYFFNVICEHYFQEIELIEPSCIKSCIKYLYCKKYDLKKEENLK